MKKSKVIIFLDNNLKLLEAMKDYFQLVKIKQYFFACTKEASKLINDIIKKENQPTMIIVIDYAMPEINGVAFLQKLTDKQIVKILYSNVASYDIVENNIANKEIDYFIKKDDIYSLDKLENIISNHL